MKSTYTVTQAQRNLPGLVKALNEEAATCGITVRDDVKAYLVSRQRMEAILDTLEILSNEDAVRALKAYEAGKTAFSDLRALDR